MTKSAESVTDLPALLTLAQAASVIRISQKTLHRWRLNKAGPKTVKVGKTVRIRREELVGWLARTEREGV